MVIVKMVLMKSTLLLTKRISNCYTEGLLLIEACPSSPQLELELEFCFQDLSSGLCLDMVPFQR